MTKKELEALMARIDAAEAKTAKLEAKLADKAKKDDRYQPAWMQESKQGNTYWGGEMVAPDGTALWVSIWPNKFFPQGVTCKEHAEKVHDCPPPAHVTIELKKGKPAS